MIEKVPESLSAIAIFYGILIPACTLGEFFLLKKHREKLHEKFIKLYSILESIELPDIHRKFSVKLNDKIERLSISKEKHSSFKLLLVACTISCFLTIVAFGTGAILEIRDQWFTDIERIFLNGSIFLFFLLGVLLNLLFDIPSMVFSRLILRKLTTTKDRYYIPLISLDIAVALLLSTMLLTATFYTSLYLVPNRPDKFLEGITIIEAIRFNFDAIVSFVTVDKGIVLDHQATGIWLPYVYVVFSVTTLVPTLIFLILVSSMFAIRMGILPLLKHFPMIYIGKATEESSDGSKINVLKFKPFKLFGIVFGAFYALGTALSEIGI